MNPIQWLESRELGFQALPQVDREAIANFSLLWSLFEASALNRNASAHRIVALTEKWSTSDVLPMKSFAPILDYFKNRYFQNGEATHHFPHLNLRPNDKPDLVESVLRSEDGNPSNTIAAVLIIVFRFRNNLFHGEKWAYDLQGQLQNFNMANDALMFAIECNGP
jgi:hypothetical protein